jgi:hypothetical protein
MALPSLATSNIEQNYASEQAYSYATRYGLTLTSGYRSPSKNASVGGGSTSFHTTGEAYDFAGSPSAMKKLSEWAKSSGLFTEVLYETAGHYDHVHLGWGEGKHQDGKTYIGDHTLIDRNPTGINSSTSAGEGSNVGKVTGGLIRFVFITLVIIFGVVFFFMAFPATQQMTKLGGNKRGKN